MKPKPSYLKKKLLPFSIQGKSKKAKGFVLQFIVRAVDCRTPMRTCYFSFLCHNIKISFMKTH